MLQFGASLTDDTRSVNYDRNTFIIQATDLSYKTFFRWFTSYCHCHPGPQHSAYLKRVLTLSTKGLFATLSINDTQHSSTLQLCWVSCFIYCYAQCHYAECWRPSTLAGNTKGGSITVPLTSSLTGLESAVWQLTLFVFIYQAD